MTVFLIPQNNANSTLLAAITAGATSLAVAAGEGARFPATFPYHISIDNEIIQVTGRAGDAMTVVRAQESTAGAAHSLGAAVRLNITAKAVSDLNGAVNALELALPAHAAVVDGVHGAQSFTLEDATPRTYTAGTWYTMPTPFFSSGPLHLLVGVWIMDTNYHWMASGFGQLGLCGWQNAAATLVETIPMHKHNASDFYCYIMPGPDTNVWHHIMFAFSINVTVGAPGYVRLLCKDVFSAGGDIW